MPCIPRRERTSERVSASKVKLHTQNTHCALPMTPTRRSFRSTPCLQWKGCHRGPLTFSAPASVAFFGNKGGVSAPEKRQLVHIRVLARSTRLFVEYSVPVVVLIRPPRTALNFGLGDGYSNHIPNRDSVPWKGGMYQYPGTSEPHPWLADSCQNCPPYEFIRTG